MNTALFTSAAGMMDNAQKMETIVHNLANANTTAYKRHLAISVPFTRFLDEELDNISGAGGEVFVKQHIRYCYGDGIMKFTERNLDVALQDQVQPGKGETCCFFNVKVTPRTVTRPRQYNIEVDKNNQLQLREAAGADGKEFGDPAKTISGDDVKLPEGTTADDISVDPEGFVYVNGKLHAQLRDHQVTATLDPGIQYTRNGNLHLQVKDGQSHLVTVDGYRIQGQSGDISFDEDVTARQIFIDLKGRIYVEGEQIDQLKITVFKDVPFSGKLGFSVDSDNYVVNARGRRIVDVENKFIVAPKGAGSVEVTDDGKVVVGGETIALTLERPGKVVRGEDEPMVTQTRYGYYVPTDEFVSAMDAEDCETHQCYLEQSNVNVVAELSQMIITMRSYEADAKLLQTMEQNLRSVTNSQPA